MTDAKHPFHIGGGMVDIKAPSYAAPYGDHPDNPNRVVGEKVTETANGKTVIKWDLVHSRRPIAC